MIAKLKDMGINLQYFDCGGGLGIQYNNEEPPLPADYGKEIIAATKDLGMHLLFEPGRNIVGNAGILVARCLYTKERDEKNFIMIDAGMNDLARPALYGSFHGVQAGEKGSGRHDYRRHRRADLRIGRLPGQGQGGADVQAGRPDGLHVGRRLRLCHEQHLQQPAAGRQR